MIRWISVLVVIASLGLGVRCVSAREWKSSDGSRTMQGRFVALKGGQLSLASGNSATRSFPVTAFSTEDQKFAANAQAIADAATKWGPQTFEVNQIVEGGRICRLALPPTVGAKGPLLFSGEMFYLGGDEGKKLERGAQFTGRLLFGAGGRTYHPLKGEPVAIRAFALDAEEATQVWTDTVASSGGDPTRQSPAVLEPEIDVVTTRGIGIAIAKGGLFVIDASIARDADTLLVYLDGEAKPAKVVKTDDKLGITVVSCALPAEPPRIGARKPPELGQSVYAVSFELSSNKRAMAKDPVVTHGVISRFGDAKHTTFEHDAKASPESVGGFVVGMKGEVVGFFFRGQSTTRALTSTKAKTIDDVPPVFAQSVSTAALEGFIGSLSGVPAMRMSPTETDVSLVAKDLIKGTALVVATREVRQRTREPAVASKKPDTQSKMGTGPPPAGSDGWSLSKSGTRHNPKCRFFDPKLPCTATDGKPCKICGG